MANLFHWIVFFLLAFQFATGWQGTAEHGHLVEGGQAEHNHHPSGSDSWNKAIGLLAAIVIFGRILWRISTALPEWSASLTVAEKRFSKAIERVLYFLMAVVPIAGIATAFS